MWKTEISVNPHFTLVKLWKWNALVWKLNVEILTNLYKEILNHYNTPTSLYVKNIRTLESWKVQKANQGEVYKGKIKSAVKLMYNFGKVDLFLHAFINL